MSFAAAWSEALKYTDRDEPAISHKSPHTRCWSTVVFFKKHPFQGTLSEWVGRQSRTDGKVRVCLSRKGQPHLRSNFGNTREEAIEDIRRKSISMKLDWPAISHTHSVEEGVKAIHQIYGLYRDGKGMSELFKLSAAAWEGLCQAGAVRVHTV